MRIYMGNAAPVGAPGPCITYTSVSDEKNEDGSYREGYVIGTDAGDVKDHLFDNPGLVTHMPGNGIVLNLLRSYADHGTGKPTWVSVDPETRSAEEGDDLERFLSELWKCDRGAPADVEETHYTFSGPPGVGPADVTAEGE